MKKLISILVAFAMMATLAVTMSFAATNQSTNLANCKITKIYDVPTGVAAPEAKFYFKVTPTDFPNSTALTEKFEYIEYAANAAGGEVSKNLPLSDFIAYGKNASGKDFNLTQPGEYEFTVVEVAGTPAGIASDAEKPANTSYFIQDTDTTTAEDLAFEGKQYTLRIYLVNGATDLEVRAVTLVDSTKTDDDTTEDVDESKVSPETGFQFKNVYTKVINETEANGGAFNVSKTVTGVGDTSVQFPFDVKIELDDATTPTPLVGKVGTTEYTFTFTDGVAEVTDVMIAHNQKLVFTTFPAGAKVSVKEKISNSGIQNAASYVVSNTGAITESVKDAYKTSAPINAKSNVAVTNDLDQSTITPEGILISNLPYIALALVAIGGLVAYVVIRRRNADEA